MIGLPNNLSGLITCRGVAGTQVNFDGSTRHTGTLHNGMRLRLAAHIRDTP